MAADDLLIERLLRVIDEGRRTATYKLALLLALIDSIAESPGAEEIPTRLIAERVVDLYFPQTRTFVDGAGVAHTPRQISMKSSPVLTAVSRLRAEADAHRCRSAAQAASVLRMEYQRTVDAVEETFVRYPIPLMQVVGVGVLPFLYEVDWPEGASVKALRAEGRDRLRLLPGVSDRLVVLGPMLRPLIELHWTSDVAKWTKVALEDEALRSHLFGRERVSFPAAMVRDLRDLQVDECFYCGDRLGSRVEVDHFLAWARWPNDAIENLVVADRCNGAKSDHLAGVGHLIRWRLRITTQASDLATIAGQRNWVSARDRSWALVKSTYSAVAPGTPLWVRGNEFELAATSLWGND